MKFQTSKIKKVYKIASQPAGWRKLKQKLKQRFDETRRREDYRKWVKLTRLSNADRANIRREISEFSRRPLISIVLPVYNVEEKWLRLCIESVFRQLYENWELCIADDCSPAPHVRKVLAEYARKDRRVKLVFRDVNGHISAASNSALSLAAGEFAALLDHDDELAEEALYFVAAEINDFPDAELIYTDEDMITDRGERYEPKFKPDWSPDFFYSLNLVTHLAVYRTEVLRKIGGFRLGLEGSQDYDLALRVVEQISVEHIRHIPHVLYHWRAIPGSVALSSDQKNYAHEAARRAISNHFERIGVKATVAKGYEQFHRAVYALPSPAPSASLIVTSGKNKAVSKNSIEHLLAQTDYSNFEILLASEKQISADARVKSVKNLVSASPAAICNQIAERASGDVLVFVDGDLQPAGSDWLREILSHAMRPEIGAVGAKLLYRDGSIQHAGYIIGINQTVGNANNGLPGENAGYFARAQVINNFSAVSNACLAVRRHLFNQIGGFDAENLPNRLYDADFCLRLAARGYRTVWTPYSEMTWTSLPESRSGEFTLEENYFKTRWSQVIRRDPFYNPNLSRTREDFALTGG